MPYNPGGNLERAEAEFPNLVRAVEECERTLKKLRRLRNRGLASERDVEAAREARDLLLTIVDAGNWISDRLTTTTPRNS